MFERFSDRARKIMELANEEAVAYKSGYIGPEHILLGVIAEGSGVGANYLMDLGIDLIVLRQEVVNNFSESADVVVTGKLEQTPSAQNVVRYAIEEARNLGHTYVGSEHLMLGLLREEKLAAVSLAAASLRNMGVNLETAREGLLNLFGGSRDPAADAKVNVEETHCKGMDINDMFSDRARKILELAKEEADKLQSGHIDTEHILLGLIKEGRGVGAKVLKDLMGDTGELWEDIVGLNIEGPGLKNNISLPGMPEQTQEAQNVINYAIESARALGHPYVGSEHLLLGLLREEEGIAAAALTDKGVNLDNAREGVINLVGALRDPKDYERDSTEKLKRRGTPFFRRFTDRARKVMVLANQEAHRFNHDFIGTEHILLGLIVEGRGTGAQVLRNMEVTLEQVRRAVEQIVKSGPDLCTRGKLPLMPRARKVMECAAQEADALNHTYVGTEHLLLGLMCVEDGTGTQVLLNLGLRREKIREEVLHLLRAGPKEKPEHQEVQQEVYNWATEKLTERARQVMEQAMEVVEKLFHEYVETEHILLGLIREDRGRGMDVLRNMDVDLSEMERRLSRLMPPETPSKLKPELTLTETAQNVMVLARSEARRLRGVGATIGTEHLLLGLLKEQNGMASWLLTDMGLKLPWVHAEIIYLLGRDFCGGVAGATEKHFQDIMRKYEQYTRRMEYTRSGQEAMKLARREMEHLRHDHLGTGHILLGLLREGKGAGGQVLRRLGLKEEKVRKAVEKMMGKNKEPGEEYSEGDLAEKALLNGLMTAENRGLQRAGTGHMLLGLLGVKNAAAVKLMEGLGVYPIKVRAELVNLLEME